LGGPAAAVIVMLLVIFRLDAQLTAIRAEQAAYNDRVLRLLSKALGAALDEV
jgi:hypothetical protein